VYWGTTGFFAIDQQFFCPRSAIFFALEQTAAGGKTIKPLQTKGFVFFLGVQGRQRKNFLPDIHQEKV